MYSNVISKGIFSFLLCSHLAIVPGDSAAAETASRPLYIIFDGSNSMWGELPDRSRKIAVAKHVFGKLDDAMFTNREVALRLYGHRKAGDCDDT